MAKPFRVDVVSPEATVWSGEATFIVARTPDGEIGIMADHEPLLAALVTSAVQIDGADGSKTTIGVHGGFLQVVHNQVTLLTDRAQITTGSKEQAVEVAETLASEEAATRATDEAATRAADTSSPTGGGSSDEAGPS